MALVAEMKQIELEPRERLLLAQYAERARYGDDSKVVEGSIAHDPQALLLPRRRADRGTDLWSTFNVVQENTIQGGVKVRNGKRARAIKGIDQNVKVNRLLWEFAQELRAYKTGQ